MPTSPLASPAYDLVCRAVPEFESMLTGYAFNLSGDLELARDVVQDTFIKLHAQDPTRLDGRWIEGVVIYGVPQPRPGPDEAPASIG